MSTARAAHAHALLVGLTEVDPDGYDGWDGKSGCWGCEIDVDNVTGILRGKGFPAESIRTLRTREATAENVLAALRGLSHTAKPGDLVVFYYSGHGGQAVDTDGDEPDKIDETLCCYDRQLIDDELGVVWKLFPAGVRIVMLSDSCHSGSNARDLSLMAAGTRLGLSTPESAITAIRDLLTKAGAAIGADLLKTLGALPFSVLPERALPDAQKAMLIHIGACRDNQTSDGFEDGGVFTKALKRVMDGGFHGSYRDLHAAIRTATRGSVQRAEYNTLGPVTPLFEAEDVFTIASAPAVAAGGAGAAAAVASVVRGASAPTPAPAPAPAGAPA